MTNNSTSFDAFIPKVGSIPIMVGLYYKKEPVNATITEYLSKLNIGKYFNKSLRDEFGRYVRRSSFLIIKSFKFRV